MEAPEEAYYGLSGAHHHRAGDEARGWPVGGGVTMGYQQRMEDACGPGYYRQEGGLLGWSGRLRQKAVGPAIPPLKDR